MAPLICAHGGASAHLPDNSIESYEAAIAMGADMIEADLRRHRDGRLVLSHDRLRTGATPPLLADLVGLAAGRIALDIELKEAGYEEDVLGALTPRPEGLVLTSFLPGVVSLLGELDPTLVTGLLIAPRDGGDLPARRAACTATFLGPHVSLVDDGLRRWALDEARPLMVWTVNRRTRLAAVITDPAIGHVVTDVPDVALALREAAAGT